MYAFGLLSALCHRGAACHAADAEGKVNYFEMATNLRTLKVSKLTEHNTTLLPFCLANSFSLCNIAAAKALVWICCIPTD